MERPRAGRAWREQGWFAVRCVATMLAVAGVVQYAFSLCLWVWCSVLWAWREGWSIPRAEVPGLLVAAAPAPLLLVLFASALVGFRRSRRSVALVALAVVIAATWSFCDAWGENPQIRALTIDRGCVHLYFNWPWLTELGPHISRLRHWMEDG